jgi:hypothetical protein
MAKKGQQPRLKPRAAGQATQWQMPTWVWFVIGGILAVLLVLGLFYLGNQGPTAGNGIEGVEILPDPGQGHIEGDISYAVGEPAGGPHNPTWLNCGIYAEPVRVENVVHSLEHGAVWIAYRPNLSEDQVEMLREIVRQERRNRREPLIVLAPKADLEDPIVLTAWRVQLRLDDAADERVGEFLDRFQRGPFTPEPGAPCTEGAGEPLS